jgi:hypothetical protein
MADQWNVARGPLIELPSLRRRKRKVTLAAALKEASKAGKHVVGSVIEDGKVTLTFGEQEAGDAAADELNKWRKRRAGHSQGH